MREATSTYAAFAKAAGSCGYGVTTKELRLLSGHRRQNTLHRYLGWGRWAAEGRVATERVTVSVVKVDQRLRGHRCRSTSPWHLVAATYRRQRKTRKIEKSGGGRRNNVVYIGIFREAWDVFMDVATKPRKEKEKRVAERS